VYVVRVAGPVDAVGAAALAGLRITAAPDGATTELTGAFDQAALLRLLRASTRPASPSSPSPARARPPPGPRRRRDRRPAAPRPLGGPPPTALGAAAPDPGSAVTLRRIIAGAFPGLLRRGGPFFVRPPD
jgi:hypothetical protein